MKRSKVRGFRLEALEQREVPAAVTTLSGGSLFIRTDNAVNNLVITQTTGTQLKVENNGKFLGNFNVPGNLSVTTGNSAETVVVALNTAPGFGGHVIVNTGNGNDTVDIGGLVKGSLTMNTGLGNDLVTSKGIDLNVRGGYYLTDGYGLNTLDLNDRNYTIGGTMVVKGVANFDMGTGNNLNILGSAIVNGSSTPSNALNVLLSGANVNVTGSFQVFGEGTNDVFSVTSKLNVAGNLSFFSSGGDNTFVLTPAAGGAGVGGDLQYLGGTGVDVVVFGAESSINGRTSITLGHGINTFVDTATSDYAGELSVVGGDGTNTAVVLGTINGNFSNTFGNGDGNTTVFTGTLGGIFRYRLGNGTLGTLTLAPTIASFVYIDAVFGTGDSTFNLGPNVTLSGIVRGTGGSYTFNQGTATLAPNIHFYFYP